MRGASRTLGAQEYTSQLKNRVVAKSVPQAADQKSNTVATSILANRSNRVIKLLSDPTKSCSGGWTDESGCCAPLSSSRSVDVLVDTEGNPCDCSQIQSELGCPGPVLLYPFDSPKTVVTITFTAGSFMGTATNALVVADPAIDLTGTTVTIDGVPASFTPTYPGGGAMSGNFTTSSVIVITFPLPITGLGAFCPNFYSV